MGVDKSSIFFRRLGIEPTEDKEQIKQAYFAKLAHHHPEEDPEGFKALRQAFEAAMAYKAEENPERDEVDKWIAKVQEVYQDFAKRLDIHQWQQLLQEDVCFALDTMQQASLQLLHFIESHHRLPHEVLALLERHFGWEAERKELINHFHPNYIDFVINNAKYKDQFRYYQLPEIQPDKDYDTYIGYYYQLLNLLRNGDESTDQVVQQINNMEIYHPDMWVLLTRAALKKQNDELARKLTAELEQKSNDDMESLYCRGQVHLVYQEYDLAAAIGEKMFAADSNHIGALNILAECAKQSRDFEKALEYYERAEAITPHDFFIIRQIIELNGILADQLKEGLVLAEADNAALLHYLQLLLKSRRFEAGCEVVEQLAEKKEDSLKFYQFAGEAFSSVQKPDKAIEYWQKALSCCQPDNQEYPLVIKDLGVELDRNGQSAEALELLNQGLEKFPGNIRISAVKGKVLNSLKRYLESVEICQFVLQQVKRPNAYQYLIEALLELERYQEALEYCEKLLEIAAYLDGYLLKLKCLEKLGQAEPVIQLVDYLVNQGAELIEIKLFKLRALAGRKQYEDAYEYGKSLLEEAPEQPQLLYKLADVCEELDKLDEALSYLLLIKGEEGETVDYKFLLAYIYRRLTEYQKAEGLYLSLMGNDGVRKDSLYSCLAFLYKEMKRLEEAEEFFKKLLTENPEHISGNGNLAAIYQQQEKYDLALQYYQAQLEIRPSAYYYFQCGLIWEKKGDFTEAICWMEKSAESDSEDSAAYYNIGYFYSRLGQLEKALEYFRITEEKGDQSGSLFYNRGLCLMRLGRHEEALEAYEEGLKHNPEHHSLHYRKATLFKKLRRHEEAIEALNLYYQKTDREKEAYYEIANVYKRWGKREEAFRFARMALDADQENADVWQRLAYLYQDMDEDWEKALEYFQKAAECKNADGDIYESLGDCLEHLGQTEKAKACYEKALELFLADNDEEKACDNHSLGSIYMALGDFEKAKEYFLRAVKNCPRYRFCYTTKCYEALYELGRLCEKNNELDQAIAYYQQAYEEMSDDDYLEDVKRVQEMMIKQTEKQ